MHETVIHSLRKVPVTLQSKVKDELDRMQHLGIICPMEEPTDWVSSMVVITSKPNKTRICIDTRDLNQAIHREHYLMPTIEEITTRLPEAKIFPTLDTTNRYWQIPVDEESSKLLKFNTPFGRFCFCHLPFGISSASEVFQRSIHQLFQDIEDSEIIVDDIPVWGRNTEEHDERLLKVLERARAISLHLRKEKSKFKSIQLKYTGHTLTAYGLIRVSKHYRTYKVTRPTLYELSLQCPSVNHLKFVFPVFAIWQNLDTGYISELKL